MAVTLPLVLRLTDEVMARVGKQIDGALERAGATGGEKMAGKIAGSFSGSRFTSAVSHALDAVGGSVAQNIASAPLSQSTGEAFGRSFGPGGRTAIRTAGAAIARDVLPGFLGDPLAAAIDRSETEDQANEGALSFDRAKARVAAVGGRLAAAGDAPTEEETRQALAEAQIQEQRDINFQLSLQNLKYSAGALIDGRSLSAVVGR